MTDELLKLDNQVCFPVYALSRLITKKYQPFLFEMGITYPQYLVLLVLWEKDKQFVDEIAKRLYLNTNTMTPLLKRMEKQELITKEKSKIDERKVIVSITKKGLDLKESAKHLPEKLALTLCSETTDPKDLIQLREQLQSVIQSLI